MHFILVIKDDNQVCTSRSDGQDVTSKTKSKTLYTNTNSDIDVNIAKRKPMQKELFNYDEENVLVNGSKRTQQIKKKNKQKEGKNSTTDKGNA